MGHILKYVFEYDDANWLADLLKSAPHFHQRDVEQQIYEFRNNERVDNNPTPDVAITIIKNGLEFNALGNQHVIKEVDDYLLNAIEAKFGQIKTVL